VIDHLRLSRYRRLFVELGDQHARATLDRLQVVALTRPEMMRELEVFLDRKPAARRSTSADPSTKADSDT